MNEDDPKINELYTNYINLLLRHHLLLAGLPYDDSDAEQVEEEMGRLWDKLDPAQQRSLRGLGSDINWVRRRCEPAPRGPLPDDVAAEHIQSLFDARDGEDWHGLLHALRVCAPKFSPFQLAFLRASAWTAIGYPQLASLFYDLASGLEPSNGPVAVSALMAAERLNISLAIMRAKTIIQDPFLRPNLLVTFATAMLIREGEKDGSLHDQQHLAKLLSASIERLRLESLPDTDKAMIYQLAASGFESLDKPVEALGCYRNALRIAPDNDAVLVGLGLLLYGHEDKEAAELFSRASRLDSPLVWPYFFLAHYYLTNKQFDRSLSACSQAMTRAASNSVRAELLGWAAICQSQFLYPDESVRTLFRSAQELDPSNGRIDRNWHAFEEARTSSSPTVYDIEPAESLKVRSTSDAHIFLMPTAA